MDGIILNLIELGALNLQGQRLNQGDRIKQNNTSDPLLPPSPPKKNTNKIDCLYNSNMLNGIYQSCISYYEKLHYRAECEAVGI